MDRLFPFLHRLYLETPACLLAWPAAAMAVGTILATAARATVVRLAVVPRRTAGLIGIVTSPFIHLSAAHLAANLPAFLTLGALVLRRNEAAFVPVAVTITLAQGGLLWLLGRNAAHVGMSGVIFGFLGYLLAVAWFTRTTSDLLVAGGVVVFYGGMLAGLKPARDGTSWEGHLFGLLAGLARAWFDTL
ncbi:MAG TPA: rhomboid family intramembrane serine protease [Opitutaceae bacterium]|nr:rhomboid family intramembrane serine protease [Opitutaceae bacterium]